VKDFPSEPQNRTETKHISYHLWKLKVDCLIHYSPTLLLLNVKEERKAGQKQRRKEEERIVKKETAEEKKKTKGEKQKKAELGTDAVYSILVLD
jgi:hypothetical protein